MGYFVSVVLFLIAITQHFKRKTWVYPDTIYCYEWSLISFLASLHLFTMYSTSFKTWVIILIGSISFCIGVRFGRKIKSVGVKNVRQNSNYSFYSNNTFGFIAVVLLMIAIYGFAKSYILIRNGVSLDDIRLASYGMKKIDNYEYNNNGVTKIFTLVRDILRVTLVADAIDSFISNMRRGTGKILIALLIEVTITFTYGGRFSLAYLIIELLVCFSFYMKFGEKRNSIITPKVKKWIRNIIILLVGLILVITLIRGAKTYELMVKCYRYICGNIKFFDLHVEQLDKSKFKSNGYAALYGMWQMLLPFTHILGFDWPNMYIETINNIMNTQEYLHIGTNMSTNAFITPFYFLYADFRWAGIVIGMLAFGIISGHIFKKAVRTIQPRYIVFYLILSQMIFKTLQMYPLCSDVYFWGLIFIMLVIKIKKRDKNEYCIYKYV